MLTGLLLTNTTHRIGSNQKSKTVNQRWPWARSSAGGLQHYARDRDILRSRDKNFEF